MTDVDGHREWLLSLLEPSPGASILDLGCGKGADLLALAGRIDDPDARFLGVDASEDHLAVAREAASDARVEFRQARVGPTIDLGDAAFDVVLSQELMECIRDVEAFVPELARVLRPDGQLVVSHYDWDTQVFSGSDRDRTRRILRGWADWKQSWMDNADPWMGRRLWGYLQGSGLFEGAVHVRVMTNTEFAEPWHGYRMAHWVGGLAKKGQFSQADYDGFLEDLTQLAEKGEYFWSVNRYVYVGRRKSL